MVAKSIWRWSVVLGGLLIASTASMGQVSAITGTWTGTVSQNAGSASTYTVVMTITANGAQTDYPELSCGGNLSLVGAAKGYVFYTETITRGRIDNGGKCIDGSVTVTPAGNQLTWGWIGAYQGKTYAAWSTLVRK
jgi:hypothetical protein